MAFLSSPEASYISGTQVVVDGGYLCGRTLPSPGMIEAMSTARPGDEQAGEDPTVRELEAELAGVLGQEAAVFVPSATMANVIALLCQVRPGEEVLGHEHGYLFRYEAGGSAAPARCPLP